MHKKLELNPTIFCIVTSIFKLTLSFSCGSGENKKKLLIQISIRGGLIIAIKISFRLGPENFDNQIHKFR